MAWLFVSICRSRKRSSNCAKSTRQAPDCFIARLKFGELLMRLRICDQAAEQTQKAAELAANDIQADLARRQAATIRTMRREGIERGGLGAILPRLGSTRPQIQETGDPARSGRFQVGEDVRDSAIGAPDRHTSSCK